MDTIMTGLSIVMFYRPQQNFPTTATRRVVGPHLFAQSAAVAAHVKGGVSAGCQKVDL